MCMWLWRVSTRPGCISRKGCLALPSAFSSALLILKTVSSLSVFYPPAIILFH